MASEKRRQASKFISGLLRHFPDEYELGISSHGWADTDEVIGVVKEEYDWMSGKKLVAIVRTDEKGRFEVEGKEIRASYGHSIDVTIENQEAKCPDELYHGTEPTNVSSILEDGLKSMSRQAVHLTDSQEEAIKVGKRHCGAPQLLRIDAEQLSEEYEINKSGESVYTVERVPSSCVEIVED